MASGRLASEENASQCKFVLTGASDKASFHIDLSGKKMKTHGNITLRLETEVLEYLKQRASRNVRSVSGEVQAILLKLKSEDESRDSN